MSNRGNRYFLPGDGIAREVVTADICRYLGNDALVKPGDHQGRPGFWVTAYRALTTDMIADLKADSARWKDERAQASRLNATGRPANGSGGNSSPDSSSVPYKTSRTHEARQINGPSEFQESPLPANARLQHHSYDDASHNTGAQYGESSQQPNWEQQQYYQQHQAQPALHNPGGAPPGYPPNTGYSTSEGYPNQYRFEAGAAYQPAESGQPRASNAFPGYQPGQNPGQQYADPRNHPQGYGQGQMNNPSPGIPAQRQPAPRDPYARNDPYGGR